MTIYYTSNDASAGFDATSVGGLPNGWVSKVGTWQVGTTQVPSGHTHSFGATTQADGDVVLLTGVPANADMQISVVQKIPYLTSSTAPMLGTILRMDAAYANGYLALVDTPGPLGSLRFYLFKKVSGSFSLLHTSSIIAGITFAAGDTVVLRAQIQGSTFSVKLWPTRLVEPATWQVSIVDSSVSGAGYAGLYYALDNSTSVAMAVSDVSVSDPASVSVSNPGTVTAGGPMVVSGTYGGQAPSGLAFRFDSAGYVAVPSPNIGSGVFDFVVTAPSVGSHTVSVQETNLTEASGTSSSFNATAATLSVVTPSGVLAGRAMTVSGTYSGAAPTGLSYRFDAGAYTSAGAATIGGGSFSFVAVGPGTGPHTLTVQDAGNGSAAGTSGTFLAAIPPDAGEILYSPYTWNVQPSAATAANAGAYFRTLFTGNSCTLLFDVSAMVTPPSQVWWRIDNGPWTRTAVAANVACTLPAETVENADVPYHLLEVVIKAMTETQNRWNGGPSTRVVFTGLVLGLGATVAAPMGATQRVIVLGDSITEGVRALGEIASLDVDRNDARMSWAYCLGPLLGVEVGVVGFGAAGLTVGGSGNVPALPNSWSFIYAGASRIFSPVPALVVINIGTNDGTTNTVAAMSALINGIIAAVPGVMIAVMRPFSGLQSANLQAAIAACSSPGMCRWIETAGFFDTGYGSDGLALHPSGPNNVGRIAPAVAAALRPLIAGSNGPTFRGGFLRALLG